MKEMRLQITFERYEVTAPHTLVLSFLMEYPSRSFSVNQIQAAILGKGVDVPSGQIREILRYFYLSGQLERLRSGHIFRYRILFH